MSFSISAESCCIYKADLCRTISIAFQVEEADSLVTELAKVTAKERALLEQCMDFIAMIAAIQVNTNFAFFPIIFLHHLDHLFSN